MKNLILIILLIGIISSCSYNQINCKETVIEIHEHQLGGIKNKNLNNYFLTNQLYIVDSVGKYKIGDIIKFCK